MKRERRPARVAGAVLALALLGGPARADTPTGTPPLRGKLVVGELLLGGLCGAVAGSFTGFGAHLIAPDTALEKIGAGVGLAAGPPACIHVVGSSGDQTGSLNWAITGSVIGATLSVAASLAIEDASDGYSLIALALGSPIVATTFYNLHRRHKSHSTGLRMALINLRDGRLTLGVPLPYAAPDMFLKGTVKAVRLVDLQL